MGATENLKPNLVGLSNMAIQFLPKDYKLVEVVEATREIISGVRYELLVAALDENDEDVLCRIVVTEITWKVTAWGDKQRDLNYSNCTSNATTTDDNVPQLNDFNFNPLFVSKTNLINDEDLKLLESQILNPKQTGKSASKPKTSEMTDFDLSNLEAMIIPSKASQSKVLPKTSNEPNVANSLEASKQKVSELHTVKDCNKPLEYSINFEVLPETQLNHDSIPEATSKTNFDHSHGVLTKSLSSTVLAEKISTAETERSEKQTGSTESGQQENTLNGPKLEEITLESERVLPPYSTVKDALETSNDERYNNTESSDVGTNTENSMQTYTLPVTQTTESEAEALEGETTFIAVHNESTEQYRNGEEIGDPIQPKIESVSLLMEDSVVPPSKTSVIFEQSTEENQTVVVYATDSYQESDENRPEIDRAKRDINTEMLFLERLTKEALEQLDYVDADNFKRIVLDIVQVKKVEQENGAIYVIKVRTANSNCVEESDDHQTCLDDVIKDTTKICFIEVKIIMSVRNAVLYLAFSLLFLSINLLVSLVFGLVKFREGNRHQKIHKIIINPKCKLIE